MEEHSNKRESRERGELEEMPMTVTVREEVCALICGDMCPNGQHRRKIALNLNICQIEIDVQRNGKWKTMADRFDVAQWLPSAMAADRANNVPSGQVGDTGALYCNRSRCNFGLMNGALSVVNDSPR